MTTTQSGADLGIRGSGASSPGAGSGGGRARDDALSGPAGGAAMPFALPRYTAELAREMAPLYARLRSVTTPLEWSVFAPYIKAILELKRQRDAVILAHNYMTPEIFHTVADIRGDSLQLAREAARTRAGVIVMCGVHFMAETAKLLNPDKLVLIPDARAGCSLAESITPEDVRRLRARHPGVPVITYVNTSAAVKAECDICCTSANVVKVVESFGAPRVILLPDEYLAQYAASRTAVEIIRWKGHCEVHERFSAEEIREYREAAPGVKVIAHPECPPEVIAEADFTGSTAGMIKWVKEVRPQKVLMLTECSMSDNAAVEAPEVEFVRPCNLCPHMKRMSLESIFACLAGSSGEVTVEAEVAERARRAVERMIALDA